MCRSHAAVRQLLGGILTEDRVITVVDMEAGLEHLSRGTERHVDTLLVMLEPYYKALETARRTAELGRELGIARIEGVANKLRDRGDGEVMREYAGAHGIPVLAEIPYDDGLRHSDLEGSAPIDAPRLPSVRAIESLADRVLSDGGYS